MLLHIVLHLSVIFICTSHCLLHYRDHLCDTVEITISLAWNLVTCLQRFTTNSNSRTYPHANQQAVSHDLPSCLMQPRDWLSWNQEYNTLLLFVWRRTALSAIILLFNNVSEEEQAFCNCTYRRLWSQCWYSYCLLFRRYKVHVLAQILLEFRHVQFWKANFGIVPQIILKFLCHLI